jgi:hypothetical protein
MRCDIYLRVNRDTGVALAELTLGARNTYTIRVGTVRLTAGKHLLDTAVAAAAKALIVLGEGTLQEGDYNENT